MRNPIRTLVGLVRPPRHRADGEPKSARKRAIATPTPGSREDLLLAAVREEFESFTQDVASEQARVHKEFTDSLDGLRTLLTSVEEADVARVDELRDEFQLTREGLVKSFAETRRRGGECETSRNRRRDWRAGCEAIAAFKPDSTRSKLAPRDSNASSRSTPTRTAPGGDPEASAPGSRLAVR